MDIEELIFKFCPKRIVEPDCTWLRQDDVERLIRFLLADQQKPE